MTPHEEVTASSEPPPPNYSRMSPDAFVENAKTLVDLGWHPIPLTGEGGKTCRVQGVQGRPGVDVSKEDTFREWADSFAGEGLNLGVRMPVGVVGIDVDAYDGKGGAETLAAKELDWGPLPATWSVTARSDGSRKMFFRVPAGWESKGIVGPGVEVIQRHHRYSVAPPSRHDVGLVKALAPDGHDCGQLPPPDDLPELPQAWLDGLGKVAPTVHAKASTEDAALLADSLRDGPMDAGVTDALNVVLTAVADGSGRHDSLNEALPVLARLGAAGRSGVAVALRSAEAEFVEAVSNRATAHEARREFQQSWTGALGIVAGERAGLDFYTANTFGPDGKMRPDSPLARSLRGVVSDEVLGIADNPIVEVLERFPLVSAAEMAKRIPPIDWLVKGVWPRNSFGPIAGAKKTLKSYNAIAFALAVASGQPLLGEFEVHQPGPVLYLNGEGGKNLFHRRTQAIAQRYGVRLEDLPLHAIHVAATLDSADFLDAVQHYLDQLQPELVVLDPLYAYHPKGVDAGNVYERGPMLADFREKTVGDEAALLIADHFNKGAKELDLDSIGYSGMSAWADSWWIQRHRKGGPNLDTGEYPLEVQFGSRQWGGRVWNLDWKLPPLDHVERAEDGDDVDFAVDWSVQRPAAVTVSAEAEQASLTMQIFNLVKAQPGQLTKTAVKNSKHVTGRKQSIAEEVDRLIEVGALCTERSKLWAEPLKFSLGES